MQNSAIRLSLIAGAFTTVLSAATQRTKSAQEPQPAATLNYELRLEAHQHGTDLRIDLRFNGGPGTDLQIGLPEDSEFGTPELWQYVAEFEALDGTLMKEAAKPSLRRVRANQQGEVHLRYLLSIKEGHFGSRSYAPAIGPGYLHFFGSQWLMRIGDRDEERLHRIKFIDLPQGWHAYSSLGANPESIELRRSYAELERSALGAIRGGHANFELAGKQVASLIEAGFARGHPQTSDSIRSIVTLQRNIFGHDTDPFFNVVVLPRPGNVAGIALPNLFVCFVKNDISALQLNVLLAHEMLHSWTHIELGPEDTASENFVRNQWLIEGVTDFMARRILLDAGIVTEDEFVSLINRDIINLSDNPHHGRPFAEIMVEAHAGKFGTSHAKLSYYRGALIALGWEHRLRENAFSQSLAEILGDLYRLAKTRERFTYEEFFTYFDEKGIDVEGDLERYILQGRPIELNGDALGKGFELVNSELPRFDPGFSMSASRAAKRVRAVDPEGPAYRAGLRNGMPLIAISNSNRFSNAWDPEAPLVVRVEIEKVSSAISYLPRGDSKMVLQLYRRK